MNKKAIIRTRESNQEMLNQSNADVDDLSSNSEDEDNNLLHGASGDRTKKPRIPWDRNPRGDKNGLKLALLTAINESRFHVEGRYMENFKKISQILSQEGSKFEKYQGIEPSGAQRKFNSIIKDIANNYKLLDNGDFQDEQTAEGFEALAIQMLKDIIVKEKAKYAATTPSKNGPGGILDTSGADDAILATIDEMRNSISNSSTAITPTASILKKRKAEMAPLKHALKRVAALEYEVNAVDEQAESGINRLDLSRHERVVQELANRETPILTVGDLLKAAEITESGISAFVAKTQVKLTKPVDRILKLYEEVAVAKDFVARMNSLCGLQAGDALEFESFIKPLYISQ